MGFSIVVATAIIGVSILMAIEIIVSDTFPTITDVNDALDNMKDRIIDQKQTSITITDAEWDNPNTIISVSNTGSVTVNTSYCNILVNGLSKQFTSSVSYLYPKQTALFLVAEHLQNKDIIKIITPNGVSDYYEYTLD